jgi:phage shock protein PspC (stress-responsive transcriptional regulator)
LLDACDDRGMAKPATAPTRRLYRRRNGRLVAGVSAGLADHLGIDVLVLRIGFVVTVVLGGLGVLLYAAFWAVVPLDDAEPQ